MPHSLVLWIVTADIKGMEHHFIFLSLVLKTVPVGIAYAIWSGIGITLISLTAAIFFKQIPDIPAIIGIVLIVSGMIIINLFSKMASH